MFEDDNQITCFIDDAAITVWSDDAGIFLTCTIFSTLRKDVHVGPP